MTPLEFILQDHIRQDGPISFARFMELALYHPEHGYYEQTASRIGRAGDFITSVSVGGLFGELLAWQFSEWLEDLSARLPGPAAFHIVEAGAHDGRLAADVLDWLRRERPALFAAAEYVIVEPSTQRREWQGETLDEFHAHVRWVPTLRELQGAGGIRGVVFSNELLDAMPVRRLGWDAPAGRWFEWGVALAEQKFTWARLPLASDDAVFAEATGYSEAPALRDLPPALLAVVPDGYTIEVCPAATRWWREAATALQAGWLVTCDYGFAPGEWLRPERLHGTVRAFRGQQSNAEVLVNPGNQDLTAHVNFPALQTVGEACGLRTEGLFAQERWLGEIAARVLAGRGASRAWLAARPGAFQALTHPAQFGRAFRVFVQRRGT